MKTTKIAIPTSLNYNPNTGSLIGQLLFSLINQNKDVIAASTGCKDIIQATLFTQIQSNTLTTDKVRVMITLPLQYKDKYEEIVDNILDFVNQIANDLGIESESPSKVIAYKVHDTILDVLTPNKFLLVAPQEWLRSNSMFSLFLELSRTGVHHTKGVDYKESIKQMIAGDIIFDRGESERQLIKAANKIIQLFVKYNYRKFYRDNIIENYTNNTNGSSSTASGVMGLATYLFCRVPKTMSKEQLKHPLYLNNMNGGCTVDNYCGRPELLEEIETLEGKKIFKSIVSPTNDIDQIQFS